MYICRCVNCEPYIEFVPLVLYYNESYSQLYALVVFDFLRSLLNLKCVSAYGFQKLFLTIGRPKQVPTTKVGN